MKTISGASFTTRRLSPVLAHSLLLLLLIACSTLPGLAQAKAQSHEAPIPIRVGMVRDKTPFEEGGCSLQLPADHKKQNQLYVFMSDLDDNAVMNLDGRDTKLKPTSHREPKSEPKKGDRSTFNYAAKGTSVRVDFVATEVCSPNDDGCEVTSYDATITLTRGAARQVVKAQGICGT
jgi:hypothetical protein